jgi:hypothetical protein
VLTVSDMDNFGRRGGMIRLVLDQNRVRFRINAEAARQNEVVISSKLLRMAEIVETTQP